MNLYTILGQDTLPEQVEKNKQNIAILAEEVDKLGFTPKGVYDASTEYNYNDLVFYDGKMYAVISEVAIVGIIPTNTTYWQQVTGSVIGPQGQQGPQGADGANGAQGPTGKAALMSSWTTTVSGEPATGGNIQIALSYFNRTPEVNEIFYAQCRSITNLRYYFLRMQITVVSTSAYATILEVIPVTGADGQDGPEALVYDRNIAFTRTADAQQLISVTLPFANFNRTPALNEDFIGILEDTGVCYIAQCEVQSRAGTNVTSIVANDIHKITGENGQDGQNGTNGQDGADGLPALEYGAIYSSAVTPVYNQTISNLNAAQFNRTAVVGDSISLVYEDTTNSISYICTVRITTVGDVNVAGYIESGPVRITGAAGQGSTLNRYTYTSGSTDNAKRLRLCNIIKNAKGSIGGYISISGAINVNVNLITWSDSDYVLHCSGYNSNHDKVLFFSITLGLEGNYTSKSGCEMTVATGSVTSMSSYGIDITGINMYYHNDTEILS